MTDEETASSENAITDDVPVGTRLTTTAPLNLRSEPVKGDNILTTMAEGASVTLVESTSQNGFYRVDFEGTQGWAHGEYLRASDEDAAEGPPPVTGGTACKASYYGPGLAGSKTANGEIFDPRELTAAHKTLAFDTKVRVTNVANGKTVTVRINDRGPFVGGRCLDLSQAAFETIAPLSAGVASIRFEVE